MPSSEEIEVVSKEEIRNLFNQSEYPRMIATGQLTRILYKEKPIPIPQRLALPMGTVQQYVRYVDADGKWVVEFHQFRCPDGSLGGSGLPDPKRLRLGSRILRCSY